jgi:hypothetical protein
MRPLRHVFADQVLRDRVVDALVEPAFLQTLSLSIASTALADSVTDPVG